LGERVGIVGSRDYAHRALVREFVWELPDGTHVVSGGAPGVDATALTAASTRGLSTTAWPVDGDGMEEMSRDEKLAEFARRAHARNQKIVDDCDRLVAFWDEVSRGTLDTIRRARFKGLPVEVIGAKGRQIAPWAHPALRGLWRSTARKEHA
jgi:hypothetical protein